MLGSQGVVLAEGSDLGEFWLCRQKRLDPGSYGRKKPKPVKVYSALGGKDSTYTEGCGARPVVPREGCRGLDRAFGSAWAVRDCQGTPVSGLWCGGRWEPLY